MTLTLLLYYFFMVLTALSALAILFTKNVLHAAVLLIMCLLSLAGIYVVLQAEFLAVAQIMVYAGGVLVLIIFGVMLSSRVANTPLHAPSALKVPGFLAGGAMFAVIAYAIATTPFSFSETTPLARVHPVRHIGFQLMTVYVAPFEMAGILLLMSLVGAAVTASYLFKK